MQSPTYWWVIKLVVVKCFSCGKLPLKIQIKPGKPAEADMSASQLHASGLLLLAASAQLHLACVQTYMGPVFTDA